ncbi:S-adenosyl-L-methionine-dependent methyltransferase [Lentinus tigrinus ALCF2SS1-7]|uniref:Trimethylguanosine synthase n=1 Tax=Lentinus tigrinus ALCF2SS1-6 TaxID=1328759 RepID=A0A5C2SL80_9APHY|nr:S-adenosyl-L-methionine-dependent methyltransferase [Lentinus tigrinus ALCF2SS1-6]RPD76703.1 S-adenosyl-L-methionine-dependent methyltransferase [Lentinus tigrinus ALCF2SS1-7]
MGKRKNNITGLSGLARHVFDTTEPTSSPGPASTLTSQHGSATKRVTEPTISSETHEEHLDTQRDSDVLDTRPKKKAKLQTGLLGPGLEKYDATGLVPFYTDASQVPEHLQKYFSQRERFFSLYSSGCLLDEEGWYSVTPEAIADQIAERCRCNVILDAFCGVGGNAIAFAKTCERVIALDVSPVRLALARHNAALYGVEDRIEFILADFFSFARTLKQRARRKIDVVFLSPPWGGPSYLSATSSVSPSKPQTQPQLARSASSSTPALAPDVDNAEETTYADYSLEYIRPVPGAELFKIARGLTRNIAYFLPRNTSVDEISRLVADSPNEKVEIEEEWMGTKLKALTCYFGGLVAGQEALFNG